MIFEITSRVAQLRIFLRDFSLYLNSSSSKLIYKYATLMEFGVRDTEKRIS